MLAGLDRPLPQSAAPLDREARSSAPALATPRPREEDRPDRLVRLPTVERVSRSNLRSDRLCKKRRGLLACVWPGRPCQFERRSTCRREVGRRPRIELEPTDHPLAVEQRNGITWERVQQIAGLVLHGTGC